VTRGCEIIKCFVEFLKAFESHQNHNMFALMLDFHLKSFGLWKTLWDLGNAIHFIPKYDIKKVIPLLMTIFD
jgi:hypothetical protein